MSKLNKNPNFFIVGAPKCGTTTLFSWLSEHPNVFMSRVKEPNHFNKDFNFPKYRDKNDYLKLFKDANYQHVCIGEASPYYLFSNCALDNILEENKSSKFIVCLRNPVEMMPSLFLQNKSTEIEKNINVEDGWDSRLHTLSDDLLPNLMYEKVCRIGTQLEAVYEKISKEKVHIVFLDDLKEKPDEVWRDLQSFLNLEPREKEIFKPKNIAKVPRSVFLNRVLEFIGEKTMQFSGYGILTKIKNLNFKEKKYEINNDFKLKLYKIFKDEISKIEHITNRNLDSWKI